MRRYLILTGMKPLLPVLFLIFGVLGLFFYGEAKGPDEIHGWLSIWGVFLIFLAFSCSVFSWGRVLSTWFKRPLPLESLWFGISFFMLLSLVLGAVGLIGWSHKPILLILLAAGPTLQLLTKKQSDPIKTSEQRVLQLRHLPLLILSFYCTGHFFLSTWTLDGFPDPLWYQLTGPRLWAEAGRIYLPPHFPIAFKSGAWELLYLWGHSLVGADHGGGLIAGQFFGQWVHFFLGFLGSAWAISSWLRLRYQDLKWDEILFFVLSTLLILELANTCFLAKNDWGSIFFGFMGLYWIERKQGDGDLFLAGSSLAIAFTIKYTAAFFLVAVLVAQLFAFIKKRDAGSYLFLFLGLLAGSIPLLLRNYYFTGNPLFPAMNRIFHSPWLGPTWDQGIQSFESGGAVPGFDTSTRLSSFFRQSYCLIFFILAPWSKSNRALWFGAVVSLVGFFTFTGARTELRLLGPLLPLVLILSLMPLVKISRRFGSVWLLTLLVLPTLFFTALAHNFLTSPAFFFQQPDPSVLIREQFSGGAASWIRANLRTGERVVSASETRLYYLLPAGVVRIWDDPALDVILTGQSEPLFLFQTLKDANFRYVLVTNALWDTYNNKIAWETFFKAKDKIPQAVVFSSAPEEVVLDISEALRLTKEMTDRMW